MVARIQTYPTNEHLEERPSISQLDVAFNVYHNVAAWSGDESIEARKVLQSAAGLAPGDCHSRIGMSCMRCTVGHC